MRQYEVLYQALIDLSSLHTQMVCTSESFNSLSKSILIDNSDSILENSIASLIQIHLLLYAYEINESDLIIPKFNEYSRYDHVINILGTSILLCQMATGKEEDSFNPVFLDALSSSMESINQICKHYRINEFQIYNGINNQMLEYENHIESLLDG